MPPLTSTSWTPSARIAAIACGAPGDTVSRYASAKAAMSARVGRMIVRRFPYTDSSGISPRIAPSVRAAISAPTFGPRRSARKSIPSTPQSVESTSSTTDAYAESDTMFEQVAGSEQHLGIELALHRLHHPELHRRELQRQPAALDLPCPVLRRDRAAECDHVAQRRLDDLLHARQLGGVARDEILVRVAVAGVAVDDGLPDAGMLRETARLADRFLQPSIRHRPIGGDPAASCRTMTIAALDHRRWHAMAQPPSVAQRGRAVVHDDVALGGTLAFGEPQPAVEWDVAPSSCCLLEIHQGTCPSGPPRGVLRRAGDVERERVKIL